MINFKVVTNILGVLIVVLGGFMLTALPFSFYYGGTDSIPLITAALISVLIGTTLWGLTRQSKQNVGKREGYLIVALGWVVMTAFSSLPYLFSDTFPDITNAVFESVSGLTTTGASVLNDIETVPHGILYWRSLTQWLGGMGIIVLTVALFPLLGIGGVELFVAEAPGPTSDKIHPRIKDTAKWLWFIYVGLTLLLTLILSFTGMTFFDAVNHGLTTMATGGFSTKNASIAHYDQPVIQYVIALFMFIGGINYTITYCGIKGNFKKVWGSEEFKTYLFLILTLMLIVSVTLHQVTDLSFEQSFRNATFQIISIITTTGFVSADYTSWTPPLTILFFLLLFVGACAGSTSGGIKIIRHLVFFKTSILEFKRLLHPRGVVRVKVDHEVVPPKILSHILVFLMIYLIIFVCSTLTMSIILSDFKQPILTSIGAVATTLGNVGPSIGELGPVDNFAKVPAVGKWFLVLVMLLGRLELFTVLVLFTPYFWRTN